MTSGLRRFLRWITPVWLRRMLMRVSWVRTARNRVLGTAYYCRALAGESAYNICINCDMTVSCNCRDYDGTGHLGDLTEQSLEEIVRGETAQRFRHMLAKGRLPIAQCRECWELAEIPAAEAADCLSRSAVSQKGIMVENTVICNLHCRFCARETVLPTRRTTRMTLDQMRVVAETIRMHGIEAVAFHNLGEPFLSQSILDELRLLRAYNPDVRIVSSTNGLRLDSDEKREAALLLDQISFSIDGPSQEILVQYQTGGNFELALRHLRQLVEYRATRGSNRPIIEWKYVVFRWNDKPEHIERAVALAREAGADRISFWLGGAPRAWRSRRFEKAPHLQQLGVPRWNCREVDLRSS